MLGVYNWHSFIFNWDQTPFNHSPIVISSGKVVHISRADRGKNETGKDQTHYKAVAELTDL